MPKIKVDLTNAGQDVLPDGEADRYYMGYVVEGTDCGMEDAEEDLDGILKSIEKLKPLIGEKKIKLYTGQKAC